MNDAPTRFAAPEDRERSASGRAATAVPRVTVLIPVYNAEEFLAEAIQSVLRQTHADFELLIVDDGSTDSSLRVAEGFADPRVRIHRNAGNRGAAFCRNRGLELATGEYVALLDADDVAEPERLARQIAFLDAHPAIVAVGSAATFIDATGRTLFVVRVPSDPREIRRRIFSRNCFVNSSVMFRRREVRVAGGYDEALEPAEDYDLWLRLSGEHELANLDVPLVRYRLHGKQVSQEKLALQRSCADRARLSAYADQRRRGLLRPGDVPPDVSLWSTLRGRPGTIASDCLDWANLARATGDQRSARRLAVKAALYAPLSGAAWRALKRATLPTLLTPRRWDVLRWYTRRLASLMRGRSSP